MIELNDLIKVYDDVLDSNVCNFLINTYEMNPDLHDSSLCFNLTKNCKLSEEVNLVHNHIISKIFEIKKLYYNFIDDRCFPEKHNFEQFFIYKQTDLIDTHVDVDSYESSRRFLSFTFFLNTIDQGGEITFADFKVSAKQGSLLIFPPLWMFPYKEESIINQEKFVLKGYLHYK